RTAELTKEGTDPASVGAMPFDLVQRYINYWMSASMDLFGGEDSTNAAESFAAGLKGRYREGDGIYKDPTALQHTYKMQVPNGDRLEDKEIPLRRAMNALLLDSYHADCERIASRWNRDLERMEVDFRVELPSVRFNRNQGVYSHYKFSPSGELISEADWTHKHREWLPSQADRDYVKSCMKPVYEPGKFANWIAPPAQGVNDTSLDFEYVKFH
ncbi:MAG: benzoyl-CoA 2,3-epoxidase subunit BoxB, partial [Planctomycetes bacterium]|nr:benzoyl-CoA 2,3-epoxidase subunit BoxB [Planctomycetota bacterium]